jgi:hypothetical protein
MGANNELNTEYFLILYAMNHLLQLRHMWNANELMLRFEFGSLELKQDHDDINKQNNGSKKY